MTNYATLKDMLNHILMYSDIEYTIKDIEINRYNVSKAEYNALIKEAEDIKKMFIPEDCATVDRIILYDMKTAARSMLTHSQSKFICEDAMQKGVSLANYILETFPGQSYAVTYSKISPMQSVARYLSNVAQGISTPVSIPESNIIQTPPMYVAEVQKAMERVENAIAEQTDVLNKLMDKISKLQLFPAPAQTTPSNAEELAKLFQELAQKNKALQDLEKQKGELSEAVKKAENRAQSYREKIESLEARLNGEKVQIRETIKRQRSAKLPRKWEEYYNRYLQGLGTGVVQLGYKRAFGRFLTNIENIYPTNWELSEILDHVDFGAVIEHMKKGGKITEYMGEAYEELLRSFPPPGRGITEAEENAEIGSIKAEEDSEENAVKLAVLQQYLSAYKDAKDEGDEAAAKVIMDKFLANFGIHDDNEVEEANNDPYGWISTHYVGGI